MPASVAITSPGPGEGKSSLAANLAVMAAHAGRDVVIVDADLRKPSMAAYFGVQTGGGLTEVLSGQWTLDGALVPIAERLTLLPSGSLPSFPGELVGSAAMVRTIEELERRYDLVIIDTPPVLPVSDALVIGVHVGGVIVVARMAETRRASLRRAVDAVRKVNAVLLGVVGNAVVRHEEKAYGNSYGYGYGYGGPSVRESAEPPIVAPAGARRQDARPEAKRGRRAAAPGDEQSLTDRVSNQHVQPPPLFPSQVILTDPYGVAGSPDSAIGGHVNGHVGASRQAQNHNHPAGHGTAPAAPSTVSLDDLFRHER
jgi:capsular exopolysaccharide synthesis family protein